jgi:hypothetical protein
MLSFNINTPCGRTVAMRERDAFGWTAEQLFPAGCSGLTYTPLLANQWPWLIDLDVPVRAPNKEKAL